MMIKEIDVEGMHCPSCEVLVKDELDETKGIERSIVSFKQGLVQVEYNETIVDLETIKEIIKNEGYKVK